MFRIAKHPLKEWIPKDPYITVANLRGFGIIHFKCVCVCVQSTFCRANHSPSLGVNKEKICRTCLAIKLLSDYMYLCVFTHIYIYIHTHTRVKWSSFTTCLRSTNPGDPHLHHGLSMIAIGTFRSDVEGTQPSVGFIPFVGINQMRSKNIPKKKSVRIILSTNALMVFSTKVYFLCELLSLVSTKSDADWLLH